MSYTFQQCFLEKVYYCIRFNFNEDIELETERKKGKGLGEEAHERIYYPKT